MALSMDKKELFKKGNSAAAVSIDSYVSRITPKLDPDPTDVRVILTITLTNPNPKHQSYVNPN